MGLAANKINCFFRQFEKIVPLFSWHDDPILGVRAKKDGEEKDYDPVIAMHFANTGERKENWEFHDVLDELGFSDVGYDIVRSYMPMREISGLALRFRRVCGIQTVTKRNSENNKK